jgi:hypothetical protein
MKLVMLAFLFSAFGPAFTSAECAWVLWVQHEFINVNSDKPFDRRGWQIFAALPNYDACRNAARERAERAARPSPQAINVKDNQVHEIIGGGYQVHTEFKKPPHSSVSKTFQCFPDTVKP